MINIRTLVGILTRGWSACLFLLTYIVSVYAAEPPTAEQFASILSTCAAGSHTHFEADLVGSVNAIYQNQRAKGFADMRSEADFLRLLPERDKLEGYRLYIDCLKGILDNQKAKEKELQQSLLEEMTQFTPISRIRQLYGEPTKILKSGERDSLSLEIYKGVDHQFAIVTRGGNNTGNFGIFTEAESGFSFGPFDNDDSFPSVSSLENLCSDAKPSAADARHYFFAVPSCFFGRSGRYQNYTYGFEPDISSGADCKISPLEWDGHRVISKLGCNQRFLQTRANFVFSSPDENDVGVRVLSALYWWELDRF